MWQGLRGRVTLGVGGPVGQGLRGRVRTGLSWGESMGLRWGESMGLSWRVRATWSCGLIRASRAPALGELRELVEDLDLAR